ncbi:hypothetical protein AAAC51_46205 [Priestia megaterium]
MPLPMFEKGREFIDTLLERQTIRSFSKEPITLTELSTLLYFVWGAHSCKRDSGIGKNLLKQVLLVEQDILLKYTLTYQM